MSDMLYNSAKSFNNVIKYNYIFNVARSQKQFIINMSCLEDEFTHIMGLDHLKDIDSFSSKNIKIKTSTFEEILRKKISYIDISKSDFFSQPFPKTYNSVTRSEYTLTERISVLQDIEKILDKAYTGKLYKWNVKSAAIKMPDGKTRRTNISGDYMLAIPSERNPDEKIYLFLYRDMTVPKTKNTKEQLYLFSAFADCLDLSRGQEHPYTILQETKENTKTNERQVLYIHPSYEKSKSEQPQQQNDNIKQIKFDSPTPQNILHNNSGAAAAVLPTPNPFKNLINGLKNLFKKQDKPPAPAVQADEQSESIKNEIIEENTVPSKFDELIKAREAFAEEKITMAEYKQAIGNYMHSLNGKDMWTEAANNLRKQLEKCPDNLKKPINYEIGIIERNFKKRFPPKPLQRQQTLGEIKSAAHEQYVKLQSENKAAEKEITTVKSKSER